MTTNEGYKLCDGSELCENLVISGLWGHKDLYNIVWNYSCVKVSKQDQKKGGIFNSPFQFVLFAADVREWKRMHFLLTYVSGQIECENS